MSRCIMTSPMGAVRISGDADGVYEIKVLDEVVAPTEAIPVELSECVQQLTSYFKGELKQFTFKIQFRGTPFQQSIWRLLSDIPYGKTTTYLELSKLYGDEKAIRAVAQANGKNPLWIVIPCHRVIGTDGALTGYAGGLWRKEWLLNHEQQLVQTSLF